MRDPVLLLACLVIAAGCDSAVAPVPVVAATDLETTVQVSAREVSRASPPDSLFIRIRLRNDRLHRVLVAQDSSRGTDEDLFIGLGVRWRFVITRVDAPGSGGASGGLAWQEIYLHPGDWVDFTHVIRPVGGSWDGWDGHYEVYSSLQGAALPPVSFRVRE
jgi:hypothetical protein